MHTSDLAGRTIYIFRGGDGRDYLNDLHSFNTGLRYKYNIVILKDTFEWRYI